MEREIDEVEGRWKEVAPRGRIRVRYAARPNFIFVIINIFIVLCRSVIYDWIARSNAIDAEKKNNSD